MSSSPYCIISVNSSKLHLINARKMRIRRLFRVEFNAETTGPRSGITWLSQTDGTPEQWKKSAEYIRALSNQTHCYEVSHHVTPSQLEEVERRFQVAVVVPDSTRRLLIFGEILNVKKAESLLEARRPPAPKQPRRAPNGYDPRVHHAADSFRGMSVNDPPDDRHQLRHQPQQPARPRHSDQHRERPPSGANQRPGYPHPQRDHGGDDRREQPQHYQRPPPHLNPQLDGGAYGQVPPPPHEHRASPHPGNGRRSRSRPNSQTRNRNRQQHTSRDRHYDD